MTGNDRNINARRKGLVGGTPEYRLARGRPIQIDHPLFLDPGDREGGREALVRFLSDRPLWVEVGFGKGGFLAQLGLANPGARLLGFEVRSKYVRIALKRLERTGVENVRLVLGDARWAMPAFLPTNSVDAFFLMFPDPWWKKKHHKKRFLDQENLEMLKGLLADSALLVVRSDVPLVLELAREVLAPDPDFEMIDAPGIALPLTDRERVCKEIGTPVEQAVYRFTSKQGGF